MENEITTIECAACGYITLISPGDYMEILIHGAIDCPMCLKAQTLMPERPQDYLLNEEKG